MLCCSENELVGTLVANGCFCTDSTQFGASMVKPSVICRSVQDGGVRSFVMMTECCDRPGTVNYPQRRKKYIYLAPVARACWAMNQRTKVCCVAGKAAKKQIIWFHRFIAYCAHLFQVFVVVTFGIGALDLVWATEMLSSCS